MVGGFQNIPKIPELRKRVLFSLLMLSVYRVGVAIPTPGVDPIALKQFFQKAPLFAMFDMFSGGALEQFSIFALGIMPYISASIILQLLTVVIPFLERLSKEGEAGRRKITQYTRYGTVVISIIQGFFIAYGLEKGGGIGTGAAPIVMDPGWSFRIMTVITLTSGTSFIMWLGEQISERGIGNGISLIIFAGIVARMPSALGQFAVQIQTGEMGLIQALFILGTMIGVVALIIFVERGQRRIPVQYAKRVVGRKMYGGKATHLPLKVNTAGVIPPIFASSLLMLPLTIANFLPPDFVEAHPILQKIIESLGWGQPLQLLVYVVLIIFFCYFYTAVVFNPVDVADNLKKWGGYIPGIRPGKKTAEHIDRVLSRITFGGALYISAVCVLPSILAQQFNVPFYFGGTALLIVVGVALDTVSQIESHLLTRHYDGFLGPKGGKIKGRRR